MSEHAPESQESDPSAEFTALMNQLQNDASIAGAVKDMTESDIQRLRTEYPMFFSGKTAVSWLPITEVMTRVDASFSRLCKEHGVDKNNGLEVDMEALKMVSRGTIDALDNYDLRPICGDILGLTNGIVIDHGSPDDPGDHAMFLTEGYSAVGRYACMVIEPMPDDTAAITGHLGSVVPLGIGFVLTHPVIIDTETDTLSYGGFHSNQIVFPLGISGTVLEKATLRDK